MKITTVMTITVDLELGQEAFDMWKTERYKNWRSQLPSEADMINEYLNEQVDIDLNFYDLRRESVKVIPDPEDRRFKENFIYSHRA